MKNEDFDLFEQNNDGVDYGNDVDSLLSLTDDMENEISSMNSNNQSFDEVILDKDNLTSTAQQEAVDFLKNFDTSDEVIEFDISQNWSQIKEDIIIDSGKKKLPWHIIIRVIFMFIGTLITLIIVSFFVNNRIVPYKLDGCKYFYKGYSVMDVNYKITNEDYKVGDYILYSETWDPTAFKNNFSQAQVRSIGTKTVKAFNIDTGKEVNISYENIAYKLNTEGIERPGVESNQ